MTFIHLTKDVVTARWTTSEMEHKAVWPCAQSKQKAKNLGLFGQSFFEEASMIMMMTMTTQITMTE